MRSRFLLLGLLATVTACDKHLPTSIVFPGTMRRDVSATPSVVASRALYSEQFTRTKGAPDAYTRTISTVGFGAPFVLRVQNGDAAGGQRVSSGALSLDGNTLLSEKDFSQQASAWEFPVTPESPALLAVRLAGAPQSYITVSIEGRPSIKSITAYPPLVTIITGKTTRVTATAVDYSGNVLSDRVVAWSSCNDAIATVDAGGLVTAVAPGTAIVSATSEGVVGTSQITVVPPPVANVAVTPASASVVLRTTTSFSATLRDADGNVLAGRGISWSSSNSAIATVDAGGVVTGAGLGTATVTASSEGKSGSANVSVVPLSVAHVCPGIAIDGVHFNGIGDAVAAAPSGATIRLCTGDFDAEKVLIARALTIEPELGAAAVIHNTSSENALIVNGATEGPVVLRGLTFHNDFVPVSAAAYSVRGEGSYALLDVESSHFVVTTPSPVSIATGGIQAIGGPPGVAQLKVNNSTFTGGVRGVTMGGSTTVSVTGSSFSDHQNYGVFFNNTALRVTIANNTFARCGLDCIMLFGTSGASVTGNTATDCGLNGCLSIETPSQSVVTGNRFSNRIVGTTSNFGFFHLVVLMTNGAYGQITNNVIDGCGFGSCIVVNKSQGHVTDVASNQITAYYGEQTRFAVVASDGSGGSATATNLGGLANITGNTITGLGGNAATAPSDSMSYPFRVSAFLADGHSSVTITANTVTNAAIGVNVRTGGALAGSGNAFTLGNIGVLVIETGSQAQLHGNDFTGYLHSINTGDSPLVSDLTCNYWGGGAPVGVVGPLASVTFSPWATGPIAGSGSTSCP